MSETDVKVWFWHRILFMARCVLSCWHRLLKMCRCKSLFLTLVIDSSPMCCILFTSVFKNVPMYLFQFTSGALQFLTMCAETDVYMPKNWTGSICFICIHTYRMAKKPNCFSTKTYKTAYALVNQITSKPTQDQTKTILSRSSTKSI